MEYDDYMYMLEKLKQGPDAARGDDTSKLKGLIADWVNQELKLNPPVDPKDKHRCGFVNDHLTYGLRNTNLKDRSVLEPESGITQMANQDNLEEGLFKSTLLLQAFKAIFTSPSSAKEVAMRDFNSGKKVKTHVAQIIKMHKVTACSIAYVSCQLRFALSSVTSWCSVDGDFNYILFWQSIVDFFERPPGHMVQ
ncbi:uncharacterized protein F5891DRAFT_1183109 [Suillus fuscotomentosus]|uniref:Uncharacterized protein n=1 Tax=Suillus fuscotomentosus TaxID=1912939 RepID=A0AAD4HRN2_9AGAM|nr:uncharacterized protein F5891DRAFT_1183109 [Suillus fuscotomentosus]KAG1906056.1 hypothetical protein F5891DRAFT_1183109 [Suillus fuscotomentosus]